MDKRESSDDSIKIKLVIVGDGTVGKTCILLSYTTDKFPTQYVPTVFDNMSASLMVDNKMINLGLWDTAGQQEYNRLRPLAYPHCDVFLITFDVTYPASFTNACKKWYSQLQENRPQVPKLIIGNKIDKRDSSALQQEEKRYQEWKSEGKSLKVYSPKVIIPEFGKQEALKLNCKYLECSALTQVGLKDVFDTAIRQVLYSRFKPQIKKKKNKGLCELI